MLVYAVWRQRVVAKRRTAELKGEVLDGRSLLQRMFGPRARTSPEEAPLTSVYDGDKARLVELTPQQPAAAPPAPVPSK